MFTKGNQLAKNKGKHKRTKDRELQRKLYEDYLLSEILKNKAPIVAALISSAKKGNIQAIKEVGERFLGKVTDNINHTGKISIPIKSIIIKKANGN
ncbi:hypothetical protein [Methanoculleus sp.]|jgi:hypothetical protein|uniref:hypothetical protein n=1 Tax=Methanoculleus sp. TaxID=90427 RepID=UPI0025CEA7F5|nr:hypothetical protein [Methanoculleus sp.]MCK9319379.1 hypothetical protein [Methanoculleus sp.]